MLLIGKTALARGLAMDFSRHWRPNLQRDRRCRSEDVAILGARALWVTANTPTTKFRIGSMTKQFTAAAILLLEERGELKVEAPVKKYMSDAPPSAEPRRCKRTGSRAPP
jgi:hypothetical protein